MADRRRARGSITALLGARRPPPRSREHVPVTSVTDQREHHVVDWRYSAAIDDGSGQCVAACGRVVILAALATPPGPRCPACLAATESTGAHGHVPHRSESTS